MKGLSDIKFKINTPDMNEVQKEELANRVVGSLSMMLGMNCEVYTDEQNENLVKTNEQFKKDNEALIAQVQEAFAALDNLSEMMKNLAGLEVSQLKKAKIEIEV